MFRAENKSVLVVMSSYNGEKYIKEQIDSILKQEKVDVTLFIRDDGSNDTTSNIVEKYADEYPNVFCDIGENWGFRRSFYNTLLSVKGNFDYYAFSDQDDVWDSEKLYKAVCCLENEKREVKLYASGLKVTDSNLNFMYENKFPKLQIAYGSALSRQRLAGCTMVFSKELVNMCKLLKMTNEMGDLFSHDGAIYYICLACGGNVIFKEESYINFRRHGGTVTEHGKGYKKRISSVLNIFGKNKNVRYMQNQVLLNIFSDYMPADVKEVADMIAKYKNKFRYRMKMMFDSRIRCGLKSVDCINFIAILLGCY